LEQEKSGNPDGVLVKNESRPSHVAAVNLNETFNEILSLLFVLFLFADNFWPKKSFFSERQKN
jgi:hypothetical protein